MRCPGCSARLRAEARFCDQCGLNLEAPADGAAPERGRAERKYVTTLFSDLSGYTSLTEKLDPEEVREIMSRIFGEIAQILSRYEGFIERFIGDAVMAVFGIPHVHEDDAVRAVRAAREIHEAVDALNPDLRQKIGQPLAMHTGINTGIVVTSENGLNRGAHGTTGVSINIASRLSTLAGPGEILVGRETRRQTEGFFSFKELSPARFKGQSAPERVFQLLCPKDRPVKLHRLSGLRSPLIGRRPELAQMEEALDSVRQGRGAALFVCGDAGAGKSRLVEEFKGVVSRVPVQWWEAHAFSFTRNTPYFLLTDLLSHGFRIEEGDPPDRVRSKIEVNTARLLGEQNTVSPILGSLFALRYPELEQLSPELWKVRIQSAAKKILTAITQRRPAVLLFEDIHLADASSSCLLRSILEEPWAGALFICVYRPEFRLFSDRRTRHLPLETRQIRLPPLSAPEVGQMIESLLTAPALPDGLQQFVEKKVEGNPFYLEEVINSMVEDGTLVREEDRWRLSRPLAQADVPTTIHGVISARLDRLDRRSRTVLQEAAVIGRSFQCDILRQATSSDASELEQVLSGLEETRLIHARPDQPDPAYMFKHAMIHEVAYGTLLRADRQAIHARIAAVIERLYPERRSEFCETLAYHFEQAGAVDKTVSYMRQSGEKSLERYAVEDAHRYFQHAYDLLTTAPDKADGSDARLLDLLNRWSAAYYYRSDFKGLTRLLESNRHLAAAAADPAAAAAFYKWLGFALWGRERYAEARRHLAAALDIGVRLNDTRIMGECHAWLTWTCAEMGGLAEAIEHGKQAQALSAALSWDHDIFFLATSGMGHAYWYMGDRRRSLEAGEALIRHGETHANNFRSFVEGYHIMGWSHFIAGDFATATECFREAVRRAALPYYALFPKVGLGLSLLWAGRIEDTRAVLDDLLRDSRGLGVEMVEAPAKALSGLVMVADGRVAEGIETLKGVRSGWERKERIYAIALAEYLLGRVHLELVLRRQPFRVSQLLRNALFLAKTLPLARQTAVRHYQRSLTIARSIGARGLTGQALLDLGLLHGARREADRAKACIAEAISLFEACGAEHRLKEARSAMAPYEA